MTFKLDANDVEFIHPRPQAPERVGDGLRLTLDEIDHPSYLVNNNFEVEWANPRALTELFGLPRALPSNIHERNVFQLLLKSAPLGRAEGRDDVLCFHLAIAKNRISKSGLLALETREGDAGIRELARLYDAVEPTSRQPILHSEANLGERGYGDRWHTLYASFFREGTLFVYAPSDENKEGMLALLGRRDLVIRDVVKSRRPYLTPLAVVVADIQDSAKICAELPAEEYFELINDIWGAMEPLFRKYHATHGKHAGDGMACYFFPQPDSNYMLNAIHCAVEVKEAVRDIDRAWRRRKSWANELRCNIGLHEGEEWFGTYQTSTHVEFTVLGDTINTASRLSDFAKDGSIWITKAMLGKLSASEREGLHFGIRRPSEAGMETVVASSYAQISNLTDLDDPKHEKFRDIAVLPVTEILDADL